MATFGALKADLISSVGDMVHSGTATSGTSSTLLDTNSLNYPDDEINNHYIYIYDGTGQGQERRITNFAQATSTCTVSPNWVTNPDDTSKYYIYRRRFNMAAYEAEFKQALRLLRQFFLLPDEDTGISLGDPSLAASYSETVPTGMVAIHRIYREDSTLDDIYTMPVPGPAQTASPWWKLSLDGTTYNIVFDRAVQLHEGWMVEGRDLKVVGQKYQAEPTDDDSVISINPGPLIELAALLLGARDIPGQVERQNLAYIFTRRLARTFGELGPGVWPGSVIVELS